MHVDTFFSHDFFAGALQILSLLTKEKSDSNFGIFMLHTMSKKLLPEMRVWLWQVL